MNWSSVNLERTVIHLEVENALLMITNAEFLSCSSQTLLSGNRITISFLENIMPVFLKFSFSVEKVI